MNLNHTLRFTLALLILLATIKVPGAQGLTFTTNLYPTAPSLYCVAAADLNGDGKPDLIADCANVSSLVILTNNGNGLFGLNSVISNIPPHGVNTPVVAADVNEDGKMDLVWQAGPWLMIATNNGSGVFGIESTVATGVNNGGFALAAADMNGDSKMDIVCANGSDNKVYVMTNNGAGVFALYATLSVGNNPLSVAVGDLNGDGKPDVVTANTGTYPNFGNTLTVYTNNGSGFGFKATLTVGSTPACVVAADINGDGSLDLISANDGSGSLTVLPIMDMEILV